MARPRPTPPPRSSARRRGAAIAEFAVAMPVIVAIFFGMIQCGEAIMIQHTLGEAAQAGCRLYASKDATQAQAVQVIDAAMQAADLSGHNITFDPAAKGGITAEMQPVTVTVSLDYDEGFFSGKTIQGTAVMPADVD